MTTFRIRLQRTVYQTIDLTVTDDSLDDAVDKAMKLAESDRLAQNWDEGDPTNDIVDVVSIEEKCKHKHGTQDEDGHLDECFDCRGHEWIDVPDSVFKE